MEGPNVEVSGLRGFIAQRPSGLPGWAQLLTHISYRDSGVDDWIDSIPRELPDEKVVKSFISVIGWRASPPPGYAPGPSNAVLATVGSFSN